MIDAPIGRHPTDRKRWPSPSETAARYDPLAGDARYCRLDPCAVLPPDRPHAQIRVHMAYLGHPLLGDTVYGAKGPEKGLTGQCLHARELKFLHPRTGEPVCPGKPPPPVFPGRPGQAWAAE